VNIKYFSVIFFIRSWILRDKRIEILQKKVLGKEAVVMQNNSIPAANLVNKRSILEMLNKQALTGR